jgi:hypothetical protein
LALGLTLGILAMLLGLAGWLLRGREHGMAVLMKTVGMDMGEELSCKQDSPSASGSHPAEVSLLPQKLIRNAKLSLEIQNYDRFDASLRPLSQRFGYLSNIQVNQDEHGVRRAEITLRVEASHFEEALASFKRLGTVKHEEINVEDVTRSYADLEARFANKRTCAARLREIIQTRAGKLSEVIEAEQALSSLTEEMESMEAQKRGLDNRLAYSTIQAEVHEPAVIAATETPSLWVPVLDSLKEARGALIGSLAFVMAAVIVLSPWALLGLGAFLLWRRFRKREVMAD